MDFIEIKENKRKHMDLLLLGDEQENMIERYLEIGDMYILDEAGVKGICVVTLERERILEIKNIAVMPQWQRMGLGRAMIGFIEERYKGRYDFLQAGTGESELTLPFYAKCGFKEYYREKNFFIRNYDHPIFECGRQLIDMIYLRKKAK